MLNNVNVETNGVNEINGIETKKQTAFRGGKKAFCNILKSKPTKEELLDKFCIEMPRDIVEFQNSPEQHKVTLFKRCVNNFFKIFKRDPMYKLVDEPNKLIELVNQANRKACLDEIAKSDPALYRQILMQEAEHKALTASNMRLLEILAKVFLNKKA